MVGTRRPKASWTDFLFFAPDFISAMWGESDCFAPEYSPLVRAVAYYDDIYARCQNGLGSYIRFGEYVPEFATAPDVMASHPLLEDMASIMREVFSQGDFIADNVKARNEEGNPGVALDEKYRTLTDDFAIRLYPALEDARFRLNSAVAEAPDLYLDITDPVSLVGSGDEEIALSEKDFDWRVLFRDGFPIGPSLSTHKGEPFHFVHFTRDRTRVEYDQFGKRRWIDLRSGEEGDCR